MKIEVSSALSTPLNFVSGKVYKKIYGNEYYLCTSAVVFAGDGAGSKRLVNLNTGVCWSTANNSDPSNGDAHKFVLVENIKVVVG